MSVYFDIDDILMEEQRVPCTFRYNAEGLVNTILCTRIMSLFDCVKLFSCFFYQGFLSAGTVTRRKTNEDDVEEDLDSSDEDDGSDAEKDMLGAGLYPVQQNSVTPQRKQNLHVRNIFMSTIAFRRC